MLADPRAGNYTEYVKQKEERNAQQWVAWEKQQKEIARQVGCWGGWQDRAGHTAGGVDWRCAVHNDHCWAAVHTAAEYTKQAECKLVWHSCVAGVQLLLSPTVPPVLTPAIVLDCFSFSLLFIALQEEMMRRLAAGANSGRASTAEKALERLKAEGTYVEKPFVPKKR